MTFSLLTFGVQDNLEKQTQHAQNLAEKLWLTERQLEEMGVERDNRDKKTSDLNSTILRLEDEVREAFKVRSVAGPAVM